MVEGDDESPPTAAEIEVALIEEGRRAEAMREYGSPEPEAKHNVHTFFNKVLETKDTSKVGNLTIEELGLPQLPVRSYKELALFTSKVMNNSFMSEYFRQAAEDSLATSLSKDAKLVSLAVTQKKQVSDESKPRVINKSWFSKKETEPEQ